MEYPILIFPTHHELKRKAGPPNIPHFQKPNQERQKERVGGAFDSIRRVIEKCDANLDASEETLTPDRVLVFEVAGRIGDFVKAAQKAGFEWLGTSYSEQESSDDFFATEYNQKTKTTSRIDSPISTSLYAMLPTLEGMKKMLQLWEKWKRGDFEFDKNLAPFKSVFSQLIEIRRWGKKERILSGFYEYIQSYADCAPDYKIKVEIEIWPFKSKSRRERAFSQITTYLRAVQGKMLAPPCDLEEACYHAILAEIPLSCARDIEQDKNIQLITCDDIQFFGPRAQTMLSIPSSDDIQFEVLTSKPVSVEKSNFLPIVAMLDGLPLVAHELIRDRIIIDDPDDFQEKYTPGSHVHGTAMASIILNGDLNEKKTANKFPIYVRPILNPKFNHKNELYEEIPNDTLFPDILHRAVKRIFEEDHISKQHDIKLINISVCDPGRPFFQWPSPAARVLDWLSYEYNVIFVVSAGNLSSNIELELPPDVFEALTDTEKQKMIAQHQHGKRHFNRILSPAESINSICVGAINTDNSEIIQNNNPRRILSSSDKALPSTYSTFGLGIASSIKPDLVMPGGRSYLQMSPTSVSTTQLKWASNNNKIGILTASPGKEPGVVNASAYSFGTSHAAARLSSDAETVYLILRNLQNEYGAEALPDSYFPVLIKAMLAHGAEINNRDELLAEQWNFDLKTHAGKEEAARVFGYGRPNLERTILCNETKATLIGFGEMVHDSAHEYSIPVPDELSGQRFTRTLRYTVGALSPINPRSFDYHAYRLESDIIAPSANDTFGMKRIETAGGHGWRLAEKGMLLHNVWRGSIGTKYPDNSELKIKISCRSTNPTEARPLKYGIVASFEVQEEISDQATTKLSVYTRILNAIKLRIAPSH